MYFHDSTRVWSSFLQYLSIEWLVGGWWCYTQWWLEREQNEEGADLVKERLRCGSSAVEKEKNG